MHMSGWRVVFGVIQEIRGNLREERLLCPVRAVRIYLDLTSSLSPRPRSLFVSPRCPSRSLSKIALSFFLRQILSDAGTAQAESSGPPRALSIRGMTTFAAFLRNWSVSKVLEAATSRSNPGFASFYFKDLSYMLDNCSSLSPFFVVG